MSNVVKQLKLEQGKAVSMPTNITSEILKTKDSFISTYYDGSSSGFEYTLEAKFITKFLALATNEKDINPHIMRNARASIVEGVFGEFREPMIRLMIAIYEHDIDKAMRIHKEIMDQMFEV